MIKCIRFIYMFTYLMWIGINFEIKTYFIALHINAIIKFPIYASIGNKIYRKTSKVEFGCNRTFYAFTMYKNQTAGKYLHVLTKLYIKNACIRIHSMFDETNGLQSYLVSYYYYKSWTYLVALLFFAWHLLYLQ